MEEQLLHINVQRFRGGLVFKAHRLNSRHSPGGLRVIKKKKKVDSCLDEGEGDEEERGGGARREGERRLKWPHAGYLIFVLGALSPTKTTWAARFSSAASRVCLGSREV